MSEAGITSLFISGYSFDKPWRPVAGIAYFRTEREAEKYAEQLKTVGNFQCRLNNHAIAIDMVA